MELGNAFVQFKSSAKTMSKKACFATAVEESHGSNSIKAVPKLCIVTLNLISVYCDRISSKGNLRQAMLQLADKQTVNVRVKMHRGKFLCHSLCANAVERTADV